MRLSIANTNKLPHMNRTIRSLTIALSILALYMPEALAQQARVLSLSIDDAIAMSRQNTPGEQRARNQYLSEYWSYRQFLANRKPRVSIASTPISYDRSYQRRYNSQLNIDEYRASTTILSSAGLSLEQNVDFLGGKFLVNSNLSFLKNMGDRDFKQYNTIPVSIRYTQNNLGFNQLKWEKRLAPIRYQKASKAFIKTMEENSHKVLQAYFEVAMAKEQLAMAIENVSNSDTLYTLGEKKFQIASISKADLLALKLDKLNAKNSLLHAQTDLKKSYSTLIILLGLPEDTEIVPILPKSVPSLLVNREEALVRLHNNSPELLEASSNVLLKQMSLNKASLERWFDVNLSASIGFNQVAETFAGAYKQPLRQDMVSITLSIPLLDWGVRQGNYNMARSNYKVALSDVQLQETDLTRELKIVIDQLEMEADLYRSAEEAVALAEESYSYARQRFVMAKGSLNDMLLARNRSAEARKNVILSMKNYWLGYYKLRALTLYDFASQEELELPTFDY